MELTHIMQFQTLRENNASFVNKLLNSRHYMNKLISMDKISWHIVNTVARDYKLDTLIMATSLLRYSDCLNLNWFEYFGGSDQVIRQSKTKKIINVKFAYELPDSILSYYVKNIYPFFFSYDKVAYAINQATPYPVLQIMKGHNSATHIFRYLRATNLYMLKKDSKLIAEVLGHSSDEAQRYYILNDLKDYFNQLN
jgi:integrase